MANKVRENQNANIRKDPETGKGLSDTAKIDQAFALLREMVSEKEDEVSRLINERYSDIRNKMGTAIGSNKLTEAIVQGLSDAMNKGEKNLREMAAGVDKKLQENPWMSLCIVAAGCFFCGYIARGSKNLKEVG